jgi:long-chain fatty acid transport protein
MPNPRRLAPVLLCLLVAAWTAPPAAASGFGRFQHGRGTGQAGALTARGDDPSALFYNPAAITRLPGFQIAAGLDFHNATDEYTSASGNFPANHIIEFPPYVYLTWEGPDGDSPWSYGLGLDTPYFSETDFDPVGFPGRFVNRRFALELFELHPVVAYELNERWSVGGGIRYLYGLLLQGDNVRGTVGGTNGPVDVEAETRLKSRTDALGFDLAAHYDTLVWGFGAVYRSGAELDDKGDLTFRLRDVSVPDDPVAQQAIDAFLFDRTANQTFDLPWELRTGLWVAPYPELRLELDVAYMAWSELQATLVTPEAGDPLAADIAGLSKFRDWDDVLSVRLGLEGDVGERYKVMAGVAYEPSPVPSDRIEPGFPRGDAFVYAAGFSYDLPDVSFDVGLSFHDHANRRVRGIETDLPLRPGEFSARDIVWSAGARWRLGG